MGVLVCQGKRERKDKYLSTARWVHFEYTSCEMR